MRIKSIIIASIVFCISSSIWARDLSGRLGIGLSQQLKNDLPSIDLKIQRSEAFALGLIINARFADTDGGHGIGVKGYRIIFDEPQLNFYLAALAAYINKKTNNISNSGFQFDLTMGSEFHFTGLESVGFSFEAGMSANKVDDELAFETVGNTFVVAAVHFYL